MKPLNIKLATGRNRSSIDHSFVPARVNKQETETPAQSHQLIGSGWDQASMTEGIPATVMAIVKAMIPSFEFFVALHIPVATRVATVVRVSVPVHVHCPRVRRIMVTMKAPTAQPVGSHGQSLLPIFLLASSDTFRIITSRMVQRAHVAMLSFTSFAIRNKANAIRVTAEMSPPIFCSLSFMVGVSGVDGLIVESRETNIYSTTPTIIPVGMSMYVPIIIILSVSIYVNTYKT